MSFRQEQRFEQRTAPHRRCGSKAVCIAGLACAVLAAVGRAQIEVHVADETELAAAITTANGDSANGYHILLDADIELTAALPTVASEILVEPNPVDPTGNRIFRSLAAGTPAFRLFSIGSDGGGASAEKGNLTLEDLTLENGLLQGGGSVEGAGIHVGDNGALDTNRTRLTLRRVTLRDNQAIGGAGGCCANGGNALGGAIYGGGDSFVTIEDSVLENNLVRGGPAGFNSAGSGHGGAVYFTRTGLGQAVSGTITGTTFRDNTAEGGDSSTTAGSARGGALRSLESKLTLDSNVFEGNAVIGGDGNGIQGGLADGGALFIADPEMSASQTITNSTFTNNTATGGSNQPARGGSIAIELEGPVVLTNIDVRDSVATGSGSDVGQGGAIVFFQAPSITATGLRLLENSASTTGGAIYGKGGTLDLDASCIVDNSVVAVFAESGASYTADDNWWGDPTGPGPPGGSGSGDTVDGMVAVSSYLGSPPTGLACPSVATPGPEISVVDSLDQPIADGGDFDFPGSTAQGTPQLETFTVRNGGSAALSLLTDPPATTGDFSAGNFGLTTLSPAGGLDDETTFTLSCTADTVGTRVGSVSFGNDDADENPFDFQVSCTVLGSASVGDFVWHDLDGDGIQDGGEPGLQDVAVYLDLDGNGLLDAGEPFAITDSGGVYQLSGLAAGSYAVQVDLASLPTGFVLTTANLPLAVDLAVAEDLDTADFGFRGTADLSITKDNGRTVLLPSEVVSYDIVVTNAGPQQALSATVADTFPAELSDCSWTCAPGPGAACTPGPTMADISDDPDLPAGAAVVYTATCTVDAGASFDLLANTATVTAPGDVLDPDLTNNTATDRDEGPLYLIFTDGFESGDVLSWDQSVP